MPVSSSSAVQPAVRATCVYAFLPSRVVQAGQRLCVSAKARYAGILDLEAF